MKCNRARLIIIVVICTIVLENCYKGHCPRVLESFPVAVGNRWDYQYQFYCVVYDTVYNDTSEYLSVDTLYEEIEGLDTLAGWHCYRFIQMWYPNVWWYAHPDTALLHIAQLVGSEREPQSKTYSGMSFAFDGHIVHSLEEVAAYINHRKNGVPLAVDDDTLYMIPPHKLFVYPLRVGVSWTMMNDPWYEERRVVAAESTTVSAGTFHALIVETATDLIEEYQRIIWVSESGIIKDSVYTRGVATNYVGDTIGYIDGHSTYELVTCILE